MSDAAIKPTAKSVAAKATPGASLADFLPYLLSTASNAVSHRIAQQYREHFGLKVNEWRVMAVLGDTGKAKQRDLAKATLLDKVAVNRAVKSLVSRKFVARQDNASDGRSHLLDLTEEGRDVHGKIMPMTRAMERELFSCFTSDERTMLRRLLVEVRQSAGVTDLDAVD